MTSEIDPNLAAEQAALKWGPDLLSARWKLENEFPGMHWRLEGREELQSHRAMIWGGTGPYPKVFRTKSVTPEWALCLAMEEAAKAGLHTPVPPAPPPPAP